MGYLVTGVRLGVCERINMIFNPKQQLTELVRLLESNGHVFVADPEPITEALRHDASPPAARLMKRAELMDSDHGLRMRLQRTAQYWRLLLMLASVGLFVAGFAATAALMGTADINFFYVLVSVLGLNSVMLVLWLVLTLWPGRLPGGVVAHPALWLRGRDATTQAMVRLYADSAQTSAMRWYAGLISHRMWLSTLAGIWLALWLMLLVRQYSFNWESTLLSTDTLVAMVSALAWLPAKLGFAVPDAEAVWHSRSVSDTALAKLWGSLLVGSVLCYGLLPRLLAVVLCWLLWRRQHGRLPLALPYYQHIIQRWQQKVVDADDYQPRAAVAVPPLQLTDAPKWAAMLDAPWPHEFWYSNVLGQDWLDKGVLDGRDAVAALVAQLQASPAQLLLGVRAHTVPDRGVLRQLDALAAGAQAGVVVQLLAEQVGQAPWPETIRQWHEVLAERHIAWLDPPRLAQQQRLSTALPDAAAVPEEERV